MSTMLSRNIPGPAVPARPAGSAPDEAVVPMPRFLTRQPLLDKDYRVMGYELMINDKTPLPVMPGATSLQQVHDETLLVSAIDLHYQGALGRKLTLLRLHPDSLHNPLVDDLPRENAILCVRLTAPEPATLARCQELARLGFSLALDEAALVPGMLPLARHCRHLCFDVGDNDVMALSERMVRLRDVREPGLIAVNVETEETFAACRKLSFDLFQGYFFTRPRPAPARGIDTSRLVIMKLLNLVMNRAEYPALEAQFKLDAGLTIKLLRFINSPAVGLRYPIRSINHVLLMLGHDQLYRWLTLLLFNHEGADGRNQALLRNALVRARFAETLGEGRLPADLRGGVFIAGMLSLLGAVLDTPLEQAIASLNLVQPIVDALLRGEGAYAPYLRLAIAVENGDADTLGRLAAELGANAQEVNDAHVKALIWTEGLDL
jgi:c-di-GMP phosphodiesterase